MNTIKSLILLSALSLTPVTASAAVDLGGKITKFHNNASANSVSVMLDATVINPENCSYSGWYRITSQNPGYKTAVSTLLTAYTSGKAVILHLNGCAEYPAITKVTF